MNIDPFVVGSSILNLFLAAVAYRAYKVSDQAKVAAEKSAEAAIRQANAAEAQALAIPAQLAATEMAATAARQQADLALRTAEDAKRMVQLSETQIKAALRPILEFERRPPSLRDPIDYISNKGEGIALNIRANFGTNIPPANIEIPRMLAPGGEMITRVDWSRLQREPVYIFYDSEDGRSFRTVVGVTSSWHPTHVHEVTGSK
jgi:hypothetical protein